MTSRRVLFGFVVLSCLTATAVARDPVNGPWQLQEALPEAVLAAEPWIRPMQYQGAALDGALLGALLRSAPLEENVAPGESSVVLALPTPRGAFQSFRFVESSVMEAPLQAQYPEIRTYLGQGIDDPAATLRFDWTPAGFHAQVLSPGGAWYIDPVSRNDTVHYASYFKDEYAANAPAFACHTHEDDAIDWVAALRGDGSTERSGPTRRQYRVAVCTTGEYTAYHGGTAAGGLAAVTTSINRINGVCEVEFAVRLVLVANNNLVIFTNAATDPFTSPNSPTTTNGQCQTRLDTVIGSAAYDIGHVYHRTTAGDNGLAGGIGTVCVAGVKGQGYSAHLDPINDPFNIDYVIHEMGHQMGGRHTHNSCGGFSGDSSQYVIEPGSGSTIMAYAGICGSDNLQSNSDPYFNSINFDQITAYLFSGGGSSCANSTATGNTAPTVNAGADYTIPRSTPFLLSATGSDVDGNALTFCWEQRNGGSADPLPINPASAGPIVRSWNPSTDPSRTIPRLSDLVNNITNVGEALPSISRTMNFRVSARDNVAGAGGVNTDDMILTITSGAGPFNVTAPNTAVSWSGTQTVTWNVANTNAAPVNCANVRIRLSTDGGLTYPTTLLESTPNDGSEPVTLPNISSTLGRIRVEAVGNIFFDISNVNFTIVPAIPLFASQSIAALDNVGNGNSNGVAEPGESSLQVTIAVRNLGAVSATGVSGTLSSLTPTASIVTANATYPDIPSNGNASNATAYVVSISSSHPCGAPVVLRLSVNSNESSNTFDTILGTGSGTSTTVAYSGAVQPIPDNGAVDVPLIVAGVGQIRDVDLRITGTSCSSAVGATGVGIDHTRVGDLRVTLIGPGGAPAVVVMDRPGGSLNTGNNFCNTVLDDEGVNSIQAIAPTTNPYSATFVPANPLSAFDGINADGTWTLRVEDVYTLETGTVRSWSLVMTRATCSPPIGTACPGDLNGDRNVNESDLGLLLASFLTGPGGDLDGDLDTDESDLGILLANWLNVCP